MAAKDNSLKTFVVGEVLRASHLNSLENNIGAVGYLAPYNVLNAIDSAGVVFLGTTAYPLAGAVFSQNYQLFTSDGVNTTSIVIGGGGASSLVNIEMKSQLEKEGILYPISETLFLNESMTNPNFQLVTLGQNYGTGDLTMIRLHNNYQNISKCNSINDGTGQWSSLGAQAGAAVAGGTTSIEGGLAIYATVSATTGENGLRYVIGTTGIGVYGTKLRYALNLNTISNISTVKTIVTTSTGTNNSYSFNLTAQASGSALVAGWNFMEVNFQGTASASAGTFNASDFKEVHVKITPTSSQAFVMAVDDVCLADEKEFDLPITLQILDANNTQLISVDSGLNGTYQLGTNVLKNYSIGSATLINRRTGNIQNAKLMFPSGSTVLSGAAAKSIYDITSKDFESSFANKTLLVSQKFYSPEYQVINVPTSTSLIIKTQNGTGDSLSFVAGDSITIYQKEWNGIEYNSPKNSTWGSNFKILTISGSTTVSGTAITVNHVESNSGANPNGKLFAVNNVATMNYWVGNKGSQEQLAALTPTVFKPIESDLNKNKIRPTFTENWRRPAGNPENGWILTTITGSAFQIATYQLQNAVVGGGAVTNIKRNLENIYNQYPITVEFFFNHGTQASGENTYEILVNSDGTVDGTYGFSLSGVGICFDVYNGYIGIIREGNLAPTATVANLFHKVRYSFNLAGLFNAFKMVVYKDRIKLYKSASVFASTSATPFNFKDLVPDYELIIDQYYQPINKPNNNYFMITSRIANGNNSSMNFGDINVYSPEIGFIQRASVANVTGNKLTLATKLTRQDTTNQNPILFQRDALIV